MNNLIIILGSTASGKTKLAVKLASLFDAQIISADSRQIYAHMDIGTGKDLDEYKNIPYHLINITQPDKQFTLGQYQKLCFKTINKIHKQNKLPILVGGSGLYISSIVDNYQIPEIKPNKKIRLKLAKLSLKEKTILLKKLDPASLNFVDLNNPRRLNRALEVCLAGQKFSQTRTKTKPPYNILILGIKKNPTSLKKIINQRVDKMISQGLVEETKALIKKYGSATPLQTIGYAEIIDYLNKKTTLDQAVELIKLHTRQFAKRQPNWFKRHKNIKWVANATQAKKLMTQFIKEST